MKNGTHPLDRLYISERNVRKTDREIDIDQLADDIDAKGLLQNLVVVFEADAMPEPGMLGIVCGGRRFLALGKLVARGKLKPDFRVPITHRDVEDGREVSLAENLQRVDMNPADEFEGYAAIMADYEAKGLVDPAARIERCARHFGKSVRHIEERLRLAALAPDILDRLRDGRIGLDAAKAYAAYPDQDLQMRVFADLESIVSAIAHGPNRHTAAAIRARLAGRIYRQGMRHVRYVGVDAYMRAGGRVARELFMGSDDEDVLLDPALVDRMAVTKAEDEAWRIAALRGFASAVVAPWTPGPHDHAPKFPRGYIYQFGGADLLDGEDSARAILVLRIADDGAALESTGNYFRPVPAATARAGPGVPPLSPGGPPLSPGGYAPAVRPVIESEIDRLARIRRDAIEARALRAAVPALAGTPLEDRGHWPAPGIRTVDAIGRLRNGDFTVAMLFTVTAAELEAMRPAAEAAHDAADAAARGLVGDEAPADPPTNPDAVMPAWFAQGPMFDDTAPVETDANARAPELAS